jgi:hypothetical protein
MANDAGTSQRPYLGVRYTVNSECRIGVELDARKGERHGTEYDAIFRVSLQATAPQY